MKKLFLKLFLFALLFVVLDQAIGKGLAVLASKPKGGDTGRNIEVADRTTADIILFGSSRCVHHYDPRLLTDSFGLSCYNAGRDGNGILMLYPYYRMLSSRYRPKLIVYDLSIFDVGEDDHTKYLEWLRQFYGRPAVDSVVWDINPAERYKMLSKAYQYNGKALQIVSDAIHPLQDDILGFRPLYGNMAGRTVPPPVPPASPKEIDPLKAKYLNRLIQNCRQSGTQLVFFVSPTYGCTHRSEYYAAISRMCRKNHVPLFYHENDRRYVFNPLLFKDGSHLNNTGAEAYTRQVIREIRSLRAVKRRR